MTVGVCFPLEQSRGVMCWVYQTFLDALSAGHRIEFLPPGYHYAPEDRRRSMAEVFVRACGVVLGTCNVDILQARRRLGLPTPFISCLLGNLPRGGAYVRAMLPYLTTNDTLLVTSTADEALARKLVPNATVRRLPLAFDDRRFVPAGGAERAARRRENGFGPDDRVLLYAGRCMMSKNILTLLRMFERLTRAIPNLHLVLAGSIESRGGLMRELGVWPADFAATIRRASARLAIPPERLHLLGQVRGDRLRDLYVAADLKVNLTLHHDENFGLGQVEAMACGTPVVGTAWGGLKDTIVAGVSGDLVSVRIDETGAKANWWEAVIAITRHLADTRQRDAVRVSSSRHAHDRYSRAAFRRALDGILSDCRREVSASATPLTPSAFALEYWSTCLDRSGIMYTPGERSFELYAELLGDYCGSTSKNVPLGEPVRDEHVLCLPWPVSIGAGGRFVPEDPHFPFALAVPAEHRAEFASVMAVMRRQPVITVGELRRAMAPEPLAGRTLAWLLSAILLRTRPSPDVPLPPPSLGSGDDALFTIQAIDPETVDLNVYRSAADIAAGSQRLSARTARAV